MEGPDICYGPGSIAGSVIGTFLTTCLLIVIAGLLYRQWRRNKGKHLVLVTDPEIVEEAYAFDNPCFKDTTPGVGRNLERPTLIANSDTPPVKDAARWLTPWSNIGRSDKRRTLDDSCLGPKVTKVSVIGLKSRDFTGLGFNVCGNMREGIFVKDLLHRGPASECGCIHPGDRISSVKISFRSMVYEDALTILSYASPYDVELEVESGGGSGSKPATLLKKSVGPSPTHICHPLYRSQSIPELSQERSAGRRHASKRLFAADPNDSTIKSTKSTPGNQSLERRHDDLIHVNKINHHHHHQQQQEQQQLHQIQPKFGIRVLPALDGTVHRVENQNEHNTNLERRHSRKLECAEKKVTPDQTIVNDSIQQRSASTSKRVVSVVEGNALDVPDRVPDLVKDEMVKQGVLGIPSEVPAEVHNAAMAARRNRKSTNAELLCVQTELEHSIQQTSDAGETKSPQKGKRKAPAPPSKITLDEGDCEENLPEGNEKSIDTRVEYKDNERPTMEPVTKEVQKNLMMVELNPTDVTIHDTIVPEVQGNDREYDDDDDVYRRAASLGDLSKYENKTSTTLERAQSLDMTDPSSKKRKAPMPPPEDINESTEDLTKLDQIETFDRRKLKKSSEWGTLEDAIWSAPAIDSLENKDTKTRTKSINNSGGTLGRSKSNIEIKMTKDKDDNTLIMECLNVSDDATNTSLELYNLPLSKKLSEELIRAERLFDLDEDNALARIVNDGKIIKNLTAKQMDIEFRKAYPPPKNIDENDDVNKELTRKTEIKNTPEAKEAFERAIRYFDNHTLNSSLINETKINLSESPADLYLGKKEVIEEPMTKVTLNFTCPGCDHRHGHHIDSCSKKYENSEVSYHQTIRVEDSNNDGVEHHSSSRFSDVFETHFAKPIVGISEFNTKSDTDNDEDGLGYEPTVTINSKDLVSSVTNRYNISNVSISSSESNDDVGFHLRDKKIPSSTPQKLTYITEIKVSPTNKSSNKAEEDVSSDNEEVASIMDSSKSSVSSVTLNVKSNGKLPAGRKPPVPPRRSDATRFLPNEETTLPERQVVYVSEYKSPIKEDKTGESSLFENWIFLKDAPKDKKEELAPWSNGSSLSQPVTNIVLKSSTDDKIAHD